MDVVLIAICLLLVVAMIVATGQPQPAKRRGRRHYDD